MRFGPGCNSSGGGEWGGKVTEESSDVGGVRKDRGKRKGRSLFRVFRPSAFRVFEDPRFGYRITTFHLPRSGGNSSSARVSLPLTISSWLYEFPWQLRVSLPILFRAIRRLSPFWEDFSSVTTLEPTPRRSVAESWPGCCLLPRNFLEVFGCNRKRFEAI